MFLSIYPGATSQIIEFPIFDSSSTVGATLTGLLWNTVGLSAYYNRQGATGSATAITLASMTKGGPYISGGFVAVDSTNMPGVYQLGIPNAALAGLATYVTIVIKGPSINVVPVIIIIDLNAAGVLDSVVDGPSGGYNLGQLIRLMASALMAKVSGGGTSTITFRSIGDSVNVITSIVDVNGNRTSVTLSP
jgi:hypothetical protein